MKTPKSRTRSIRQLHKALAPLMLVPLVLTALTGTLYQIVDLAGIERGGDLLMNLHKGNFGPLHLEVIYPFLNALGLIVLAVSGISMWLTMRSNRRMAD